MISSLPDTRTEALAPRPILETAKLKVVKRLLDAGMSLKKIRKAMDILGAELASESPLTDVTLLSDGNTIYAAHSASEVVD